VANTNITFYVSVTNIYAIFLYLSQTNFYLVFFMQ